MSDNKKYNKIAQGTIGKLLRTFPAIGKLLRNFSSKLVSEHYASFLVFLDDDAKNTYKLIRSIREENESLLLDLEAIQLLECARSAQKINGDYAEVGSFMGGSAKLICEAKGDRDLFLFDTFKGLPSPEKIDLKYGRGFFNGSRDFVSHYLLSYQNINVIKGIFPETAGTIADHTFAFVHLDVDLYKSTLDCLEFFYPRIAPGGIILIHDYRHAEGVTLAVDNFFANKFEPVITLVGRYGLIIKNGT